MMKRSHCACSLSRFPLLLLILAFATLSPLTRLAAQVTAPKVVPPSPNAMAFAKFIDVPVSMYTGLVDVNVPIYTITSGSLSVPISLKYHSGGMQVEQIAAWTGMNWSLQANSMITRSVVGFPDEKTEMVGNMERRGYLYCTDPPLPPPPPEGHPNANHHGIYDDYAKGALDGQPDVFYFSAGNFSGKFVLNRQGVPQVTPFQKVKIFTPALFLGTTPEWRITTPDGNTYFFAEQELTSTKTNCEVTYGYDPFFSDFTSSHYPSTWMLTRIQSAAGDVIYFDYIDEPMSWQQPSSETINGINNSSADVTIRTRPPSVTCRTLMTTRGKRLIKIRFPAGVVDFIPGEDRLDHHGATLGGINISENGKIIKSFQFTYKYLYQNQLLRAPAAAGADPLSLRLFLTQVSEKGINDAVGGKYNFKYNCDGLAPSRFSLDQDHWGRYNYGGVVNNTTLLPFVMVQQKSYGGADRSPRLAPSLIGSLASIQYPTGGETSFKYSLNESHFSYSFSLEDKSVALPVLSENVIKTGSQPEVEFDIVNITEVTVSSTNYPLPCFYNNPPCNTSFYGIYLQKRMADGSYVTERGILPDQVYPKSFVLPIGHYKLKHFVSNSSTYASAMHVTTTSPSYYYPYQIKLSWKSQLTEPITKVGGLRISEIDEYEAVNGKHSVRVFDYMDSAGMSTGFLTNIPMYVPTSSTDRWRVGNFGPCSFITYHVFTAHSLYPLGSTHGSPVGYSMVTVYRRDNAGNHETSGKSVYKYTTPQHYPDVVYMDFPYAPIESLDWARGLLLEELQYAYTPGTPGNMTLLNKIKNTYNVNFDTSNPNYSEVNGVKVGTVEAKCAELPSVLATVFYEIRSGYAELASKEESSFSQGNRITRRTNYTYNAKHLQPILVTTTDSKGDVMKQLTKYPSDFTSTTSDPDWASATLAKMVNANQINLPIEQATFKNNALISSSLTKYKEFGTGIFKAAEALSFNTAKPITNPGLATITGGNLQFEAYTAASGRGYENAITFETYDASGNPTQYRTRQGDLKSFIWDDLRAFPLAEIGNGEAAHSAVSSFELHGTGGWAISSAARNTSLSYSGVQSYNLVSGAVSKAGLSSSRTYIVSFWARSGVPTVSAGAATAGITRAGWTYYEKIFTGVTTLSISGSGIIDELRLYPQNARVTTFTYKPLVGLSSIVDPNNTPTYFEYDELGRLKFTRNHNGEIVKRYSYQYQQR